MVFKTKIEKFFYQNHLNSVTFYGRKIFLAVKIWSLFSTYLKKFFLNKSGGKDALDDSVFDNDQDSSVVLKQAPKSSPRLKVKSKSTEALFSSRISSNDTGYDSKMASTSGLNDSKNSKKSRGVIENIKMFVGRRSKNSTNSSTLPRY